MTGSVWLRLLQILSDTAMFLVENKSYEVKIPD